MRRCRRLGRHNEDGNVNAVSDRTATAADSNGNAAPDDEAHAADYDYDNEGDGVVDDDDVGISHNSYGDDSVPTAWMTTPLPPCCRPRSGGQHCEPGKR